MIDGWRPEHSLDEPMTLMEDKGKAPMSAKRGRRMCPMCELSCRKEEWPKLQEEGRAEHPHYC
eukprot:5121736-Prorocentrum_lima.AAC.1